MITAYKYRMYPKEEQCLQLLGILEQCRWSYNFYLGLVKTCIRVPDKHLLQELIPALCRRRPELQLVHSKTRQYVLHQLFYNLSVLASKRRNGRKVGSLRFKGRGWYKSFVYNQRGFEFKIGRIQTRQMGCLWLGKIGDIPIRYHRSIPQNATVKQVTIKHATSGKWFAYAIIEYDQPIVPTPIDYAKHVGLDVGIVNYIYDSDGHCIQHPHNIDAAEEKLTKAQQVLARKRKGSMNRNDQRVKVARMHEKVTNRRLDFLHKTSAYYIKHYDVIGRENLPIEGLFKILRNGRNLSDAAFGRLFRMMDYKAETACKLIIEVPAPYSSIECSGCHKMVRKTLAVRIHHCPLCGLKIDRDFNASKIVDYRALRVLGLEGSESSMPAEMGPILVTDNNNEQALSRKQELLQRASGEAQRLFSSG